MHAQKNRKWILTARPKVGPLETSVFNFSEESVRDLREGEFLVQNAMLSFDPSQRFWMERDTYMPKIELGDVMRCAAVGTVMASNNEKFAKGAKVSGLFGWQDYAICDEKGFGSPFIIPNNVSDEAALSIFGMTGLTGFFGMDDVGKPKAGHTVLVSGASGATGSVAAQVAKLRGAKVIGIAGDDSKCTWLTQTAKLDAAINYKTQDISSALREMAPNGINIYFDNVGGKILDTALDHMAMNAKMVLCGAISTYDGVKDGSIKNYLNLVLMRATMQGFLIFDYAHRFKEGIDALSSWLTAGKMHYEVDVQRGLENAPQTLQRLFAGKNLGKQLLKL